MELNEAKELVENFLKSGHKLVFNEKELELLNGCFNMMLYHIYLLEHDREIKGPVDCSLAKDAVRMISTKVLNDGISSDLCVFVKSFCNMVYNWNQNVLKDKDVELLCIFSGNVVDMRNSVLNAISTMQDVHEHYKDLSTWMPPAFDISKAHLEKLLELEDK